MAGSMWAALWAVGAAAAAEPQIEVRADGTVAARMDIAAPPEAVRALIGDARRLATIDGTLTATAQPDAAQRGCQLIDYDIPHPVMHVAYRVRACPIADGWTYSLVSSENMAEFRASWQVTPTPSGGSTVRYEVLTVPSLPIPRWVIERQSVAAMQVFLPRFSAYLEGGQRTP